MSTQRERELTAIARKAFNGEALSEAEFALLEKVENEFDTLLEPSGGKLPTVLSPNPINHNPIVGKCGACGLDLHKTMHYVCPRTDCPCFPKVTC